MTCKSILIFFILTFKCLCLLAQAPDNYTRKDSLRGTLTELRTCYDIKFYHLDIRIDPDKRFIKGSNLFRFKATQDFDKLQFDLFDNMQVEKVTYKNKELTFTREFNAVFVNFPELIKKGSTDEFKVFYSGNPTVAENAPWDGGFVFNKDENGKHWIATACQGIGASIWWPNKDHQADEVDSMMISVSVPKGLKNISNGRLKKTSPLPDGYTKFDWFVSSPINNYSVALNIGDYVHFSDVYQGEKGKLTLDYWVLPEHLNLAKKQFSENVKPMLNALEYWFGPYPFYKDGYKLIETPHLGMEHQSGIAYGNQYKNGYRGRDLSGTGWGLKWDFIIVHESGHEWFGNNITAKDIADMWIHESFTAYSESLLLEKRWSKQAGQEYINGTRKLIQNDKPVLGVFGVNQEGSGDMYYKGSNLLNMIRTIINDDTKWRQILRGLNDKFYHQTVTGQQIIEYINQESGLNLSKIFNQYLRYKNIPTLEISFVQEGKAMYRWIADEAGFDMPVRIKTKDGEYQFIHPTTNFQNIDLPGANKNNLEIDTFNFYIGLMLN